MSRQLIKLFLFSDWESSTAESVKMSLKTAFFRVFSIIIFLMSQDKMENLVFISKHTKQ